MSLREKVRIATLAGNLTGELFVGTDGMPALSVTQQSTVNGFTHYGIARYSVPTFPAAWTLLMDSDASGLGPLFHAWRDIEDVRRAIRDAQREAEAEERNG